MCIHEGRDGCLGVSGLHWDSRRHTLQAQNKATAEWCYLLVQEKVLLGMVSCFIFEKSLMSKYVACDAGSL